MMIGVHPALTGEKPRSNGPAAGRPVRGGPAHTAAHSMRDVFWLRLLMVRAYETPTRWVML